jgi:hypothetical protein
VADVVAAEDAVAGEAAVAGVVIAVGAEVEGVHLAEAVGVEGVRTVAPVEWEEAADVRLAAGLQCPAVAIVGARAIAVAEVSGPEQRKGLVAATAPVGLLQTGT